MQIVILAGGSGKRMLPLQTHKSLFPFLGIPMLEHTLQNLAQFKPSQIIIVAHPSVESAVHKLAPKYHAKVVIQTNPLGMAGGVLSAKSLLDLSLPIMIIDAITVQEPSVFHTFSTAIIAHPKSILLGGRQVSSYKHGGYFLFDDHGKILKIIEKPGADNMPSSFLKLVLDYIPRTSDLLKHLESTKSTDDDIYEVGLSEMITSQGAEMIEVTGVHASLKHACRVLDVMDIFLTHYLTHAIDGTASIAKTAVIDGQVIIGPGVKIFDHATIKGPCYIGDNTVIGNGALVRSSCIERDCEIGYNTEVARSYIGPNTKCHTSYVGDSIIEGDSNLAAGTITANLRFDGQSVMVELPSGRIDTGRRKFGAILAKGVKTGIHCSLMPGFVAGPNTIIDKGVLYNNLKK